MSGIVPRSIAAPVRLASMLAAGLLLAACEGSPAPTATLGDDPSFAKPPGKGGGGGETTVYDVTVYDPSGPGVYSDGLPGVGFATYGPDHTTTRVRLQPQCLGGRDVHLTLPPGTGINQPDVPTCNDPGWVFLQLPDVMTLDPGMPWPNAPEVKKRHGTVQSANFGPTVHFFFLVDGSYHNFVFQDATLTENGGARTVTAGSAHLWIDKVDMGEFSLALNVTVEENGGGS